MSQTAVIAKVMPDSPDVDLDVIKESAKKKLEEKGAQNLSFEESPVAFGLKAILIKFAWPESQDTDIITSSLEEIENVSSATIEDYRRAFG